MAQTKTAGRGWGAPATGLGHSPVAGDDSTAESEGQALVAGIDTPLFALSADGRWRLAADGLQWVLQRRAAKPDAKSDGYRSVSFIAGRKETLLRVIAEKAIALSDAAQADLDRLPETFAQFRAAGPAWKGAAGAKNLTAVAIAARNVPAAPSSPPVPKNAIPVGYAVRLRTSHHSGGWAPCAGLPTCAQCVRNAGRGR